VRVIDPGRWPLKKKHPGRGKGEPKCGYTVGTRGSDRSERPHHGGIWLVSGAVVASVAVLGSGYVGAVVAACLSTLGNQVAVVEVDRARLEALRSGRVPFYEPDLEPLIRDGLVAGRLSFNDDHGQAVEGADVVFMCVGTPSGQHGRPDLGFVRAAVREIARHVDGHQTIVTKSTVPIGTRDWLADLLDSELGWPSARPAVVSNPEFLREGRAVADFLHPDRVVLGSDDRDALGVVEDLYRPILEQSFAKGNGARPTLVRTDNATAETIKYAANAFLATKISFINEISTICEAVGTKVEDVALAIGLDPRIGPQFLSPGPGWGGSCFGKDIDALISTAEEHGVEAQLLRASRDVNRRQRERVVERVRRELHGLLGRRIAILGVAFKPGTDDVRDSPAVHVAEDLSEAGATVIAHDPVVRHVPELAEIEITNHLDAAVQRADAVVIMTDWPQYVDLDLHHVATIMRGRLIIDTRNQLDPDRADEAGLRYLGTGRPQPAHRRVLDR